MIDVEALRRRLTDPLAVARIVGVKCRKEGRALLTLCPWHAEKAPSCSLSVGTAGTFRAHCFSCGASGDVIAFTEAARSLSFLEACALLGAEQDAPAVVYEAPAPAVPLDRVARLLQEYVSALTFPVVGPFRRAAPVKAYLEGRSLNLEACDALGVRALTTTADRYLSDRIAHLEGIAPRDTWNALGLLRGDGTLAHANTPLVLPWRDEAGNLTRLQFRSVTGEKSYRFTREGAPGAPFGFGLARSVLEADPTAPLFVVEGALDACALLTLLRASATNAAVVGLPSANLFFGASTWEPLARGRFVSIATDQDAAGDEAAAQLAEQIRPFASGVERRIPSGKDWGEHVQNARMVAA